MMNQADLFLFMGQSNMAGRGKVTEQWPQKAPELLPGAGYEFRAITDPTKLYPIAEPFGVNENVRNGINDKANKTGSMVTAFVNAYYTATQVPVVGISASKGATSILCWQPERGYLIDARARFAAGRQFLQEHGIAVRHTYMLWCQGESDADCGRSPKEYIERFDVMLDTMRADGVEHCFLVLIGRYNGEKPDVSYSYMRETQRRIAGEREDVTLVSTAFETMKERGLMQDEFHYYQQAYNEVGTEAGKHTAEYVNTGVEPGL